MDSKTITSGESFICINDETLNICFSVSTMVKGAKGSYVAGFEIPSYFIGLFNDGIITYLYNFFCWGTE